MMHCYQRQVIEYHSRAWGDMVEQGWTTDTIETLADGTRIARMIWCGCAQCCNRGRRYF